MTAPVNLLALDAAERGIGLAGSLGYPIPDRIIQAQAVLGHVRRFIAQPPAPQPTLTATTPAALEAELRKVGADRAADEAARRAAGDYLGDLTGALIAAYRGALPEWHAALEADFDTALAAFREAAPAAPQALSANATDDDVARFMAVTRSASALENILQARVAFGLSVGEPGAHPAAVWVVAELPKLTTPDPAECLAMWEKHSALIAGYPKVKGGQERWRLLCASDFNVSLAPAGGLHQRTERQRTWQAAANLIHSHGGAAAYVATQTGLPQPHKGPRVVIPR